MNWSTFVLEIINFLVLMWILKHFLYKPVLAVIARRKAGIEQTLSEAEAHHQEAQQLREQYENRLADWEQERQQRREELTRELEAARSRKLGELQQSLDGEREKLRVTEQRRQADLQLKTEEAALNQATRFASRLLTSLSGQDTEARLVDLLVNELDDMPAEDVAALHNSYGTTPEFIEVASAYPLSTAQQQQIEQVLHSKSSLSIPLRFSQDEELIAGVRVTIGTWILGANIQDELNAFAKIRRDE